MNNLILLGDYLGASRQLKNEAAQRKDSALAEMAEALAIKPPYAAILLSGAKMRWQSEYQWF